ISWPRTTVGPAELRPVRVERRPRHRSHDPRDLLRVDGPLGARAAPDREPLLAGDDLAARPPERRVGPRLLALLPAEEARRADEDVAPVVRVVRLEDEHAVRREDTPRLSEEVGREEAVLDLARLVVRLRVIDVELGDRAGRELAEEE